MVSQEEGVERIEDALARIQLALRGL